ncbi:PAS domain-containing sensor histidine kinase [Edaphobacter aggregans]|uniref:PAS domain-containing sensor histidine kinase n=1 Tax=Edaphobacter aggregans TaxID=570835 RepID=UPI000A5BB3D0|nr:PAS domain-containing sensor histidine kinase [Edaphobacter aggregans]
MPYRTMYPATGEVLKTFSEHTDEEMLNALDNADKAFHLWSARPFSDRSRIIGRAAQLLLDKKEELARLATLEKGKRVMLLKHAPGVPQCALAFEQVLLETIPTIAWTALPNGWVDFSNHHWEEYSGLSLKKGAGSGWEAAVHPHDVKRHAEKWQASVASGEPFESEARYRRADGEYRWFLVRAVPLRDGGGKILKWYGTKTDIEDRKRAEQLQADLAHLSRVTTMGELTVSLAHEIKQPIAAAVANAHACLQSLRREQPDLELACEAADGMVKAGMRASDIIDRLRSLYSKSPPQRELVDVNEIVREMVVLLRGEANRYAVSMCTDLAANLPNPKADPVQLQQVLMNLMLNGIEAMRETRGVLTVKSQLDHDGRLLISVSDTGPGLPVEKADQIFDAFFTTKAQGSGMGLAISRSIIESHGGRLWVTANDGRGAAFHFTLPTAAEVVKEHAPGRDSVPIRTSRGDTIRGHDTECRIVRSGWEVEHSAAISPQLDL